MIVPESGQDQRDALSVASLSRPELAGILDKPVSRSKINHLHFGYIIIRLTCTHQIHLSYGYQGMQALRERCQRRIRELLRSQDELVCIGEAEFAVLLPDLKNEGHAILAANRIHSELSSPFTLNNELINITAAIGIAVFPEHAGSAEKLMLNADIALETAVDMNLPYEMYSPVSEPSSLPTIRLAHDLKAAIAQDELELFFQPKIDLKTGSIYSVEALTRWHVPDSGYIDPELFISIAEHSGLINSLTRWSLTAGCRQSRFWKEQYDISLSVAINISPTTLHDAQTVDSVLHALDLWDAGPESITLEVTESMMMQKPEQSLRCLKRLRDLGIRLSIDDFGTGSSSLAYLKTLPVNELKIDKSFVINMVNDEGDLTIVQSVIDLANNFGLEVIAEGVENQTTLDTLVDMGCRYAQGYYMGRPMSAPEMDTWLAESAWGIKAKGIQPR